MLVKKHFFFVETFFCVVQRVVDFYFDVSHWYRSYWCNSHRISSDQNQYYIIIIHRHRVQRDAVVGHPPTINNNNDDDDNNKNTHT